MKHPCIGYSQVRLSQIPEKATAFFSTRIWVDLLLSGWFNLLGQRGPNICTCSETNTYTGTEKKVYLRFKLSQIWQHTYRPFEARTQAFLSFCLSLFHFLDCRSPRCFSEDVILFKICQNPTARLHISSASHSLKYNSCSTPLLYDTEK